MSARWTNKMAILQDLAYAQGSVVPVDIENPLSYDEKPPREVWEEDTEEEFYKDCMANGDFSHGPDIGMIQELLEVVRNVNVSPDLENNNSVIEISKLNIKSHEPLPGPSGDHEPGQESRQETPKITAKKKRNRNAAIVSLIETYGDQNCIEQNEVESIDNKNMKLLKPTDFVLKNEEITQDKGAWLPSNENRLTSPANMFRKKIPTSDSASMFKRKIHTPVQNKTENDNSTEVFVPSAKANEYYEKYIERSKAKQAMTEDNIWTRAERIMMEIDEKRKREKEELVSPSTKSPETVNETNSE